MTLSKKTISVILLALVVGIATSVGSYKINIYEVFNIITHNIFKIPISNEIDSKKEVIIWIIRFPRVLLALLVGASLAVSGAVTQSVLKNPLASPYTLGVSSGASLGVAIVIATGLSMPYFGKFSLTVTGIVFSLMTVLIVLTFASKLDKNLSNMTVVLTGMVLSLFLSSVVTIIMALSKDGLESIVRWSMGSLALRGWSYVYAVLPFFLIGMIGILLHTKELDALTFGEENALTLGVSVKKVKRRLIILAAILAGSAIAVSGVIGFIGLIAPHLVRKIYGSKHIYIIPFSVVVGGLFLILADLVARTIITPSELPVGAVTSLLGAPFFIYVYFSGRK
ncbi:iron ABC transporter permease [Mycoplasmatota bacterium WC44]